MQKVDTFEASFRILIHKALLLFDVEAVETGVKNSFCFSETSNSTDGGAVNRDGTEQESQKVRE